MPPPVQDMVNSGRLCKILFLNVNAIPPGFFHLSRAGGTYLLVLNMFVILGCCLQPLRTALKLTFSLISQNSHLL